MLALTATRYYYISTLLPTTSDHGVIATYITIFQELKMAYSLSVGTIITLHPFTKDFYTDFGLGEETVAQFDTLKAVTYGGGTSNSNGGTGSRFFTSAKGGSQVSSGNHGHAGGMGKAGKVLGTSRNEADPKESEEYILQDREPDADRKIYKHTTYTVRAEEVNGGDEIVEEQGRRRGPGPGRAI